MLMGNQANHRQMRVEQCASVEVSHSQLGIAADEAEGKWAMWSRLEEAFQPVEKLPLLPLCNPSSKVWLYD